MQSLFLVIFFYDFHVGEPGSQYIFPGTPDRRVPEMLENDLMFTMNKLVRGSIQSRHIRYDGREENRFYFEAPFSMFIADAVSIVDHIRLLGRDQSSAIESVHLYALNSQTKFLMQLNSKEQVIQSGLSAISSFMIELTAYQVVSSSSEKPQLLIMSVRVPHVYLE